MIQTAAPRLSFRNSGERRPAGVSDVDRDQLPESLPLMLQQLCLLRARIPAGQAHFALITCADLRGGRATGGRGGSQRSLS